MYVCMYVCMSPFSFCMFFWACVFCVCECEHKYVDVGQQGEKHKKENEKEC